MPYRIIAPDRAVRFAVAAVAAVTLLPAAGAAFPTTAGDESHAAAAAPFAMADWQPPQSLPPRFRNHCGYDPVHGRAYCANHCGPGYQFYFCSPASFGCCHPGYGYCDWKGHLRCAP